MATRFREHQRQIIEDYHGGMMGIAAVPGSGKTFTLSHLAARLVSELARDSIQQEQEVLIVTFSNSAVNSFRRRIADILQSERGLLPYVGYRVRTLHGLAHDIVRERPALVGLADDFQIIDETVATAILTETALTHAGMWSSLLDLYISPTLDERRVEGIKRREFPQLLADIARRYIQTAKDNRIPPEVLDEVLADKGGEYDLARFANAVYADYQRALAFRGAVDFDDLVRLAISALESDTYFLARLQDLWPYILEDEAQDSSRLQEHMLGLLSGRRNWVRVGDPNQAINTTFTTADASLLAQFMASGAVSPRDLPVSGRSGRPIINLANTLVRWTTLGHPAPPLRNAFRPQDISPTPPDDYQQNPPDETCRVHIHYVPGQNVTPEQEIDLVVASLKRWLPDNNDKTVAVLVPENSRGFKLAEALNQAGIPSEELLRSTKSTRTAVSLVRYILLYLASPNDATLLARVFRDVWMRLPQNQGAESADIDLAYKALSKHRHVEGLLWPFEETSLTALLSLPEAYPLITPLGEFLVTMRRWLAGLMLPIDQLVLTISGDIFSEAADIALAYKLAVFLRSLTEESADLTMTEFAEQLRAISENERRFLGFDDAGEGFNPTPGRVTVATMHASKGLEWDRVYLMAVSNYGFPSLEADDSYVSERWFVRDKLNLEAELLGQFRSLTEGLPYDEGEATRQARLDYAAERLRLLYVAITRARAELVVTWNMGRFWSEGTMNRLATPMAYLYGTLNE